MKSGTATHIRARRNKALLFNHLDPLVVEQSLGKPLVELFIPALHGQKQVLWSRYIKEDRARDVGS